MPTEEPLKLGAINTKVAHFKLLVESALSKMSIDLPKTLDKLTFDNVLYDKAVSLPQCDIAKCPKATDAASEYQYGKFDGKQTFNIDGKIDKKDVGEQYGWIILNGKSSEYVFFKNNSNSNNYYIKFNAFTPEAVISDFTPLYDLLNEERYNRDDSIIQDIKNAASVAASIKEKVSQLINKNGDSQELIESGSGSKIASTGEQTKDNTQKVEFFGIYPKQIATNKHDKKNDSVYNNIQAVVYDLPGYKNLEESASGLSNSIHHLFCYQQPDQISYTSAAQFDSPTTRGTQQPFQFYIQNNAMSLSFTLNWHIDEIRTLSKDGQASYTIQDIADIAEGFTRPWTTGTSVQPKLCKVILPGISEIGYITQAQISYSGSMSGDYTTGSGVLTSGSNGIPVAHSIYNYFYSQISVSFEMIIVKDIKLHAATEPQAISMAIYGEGEEIPVKNNTKAIQDDKRNTNKNVNLPKEEAIETKNASGELTSTPINPNDAASQSDKQSINTCEAPMSENIA